MPVINLTNRKFGRLEVISFAGVNKHGQARWLCICQCGSRKIIGGQKLQMGNTVSCGCWRDEHLQKGRKKLVERQTTHGKSHTREHGIWRNIIYRCHTSTSPSYPNYGARGISVCKRWRGSFRLFLKDMGRGPTNQHTIDRIDNDGNYEPGNCRWATRKEQANNRSNSTKISYKGETKTISQWASVYCIPQPLLRRRLSKGWDIDRALTVPLMQQFARHRKILIG